MVNRDLYSSDNFLLHSDDSLLSNDRIFVGNQTDDFVVSSFLQNSKKVLMLGLGYGGALRALLIDDNEVQVTAVDINPNSMRATALIMENYFPGISNKVNYVQSDALQYLKEYNGQPYDVICLDLYTREGYPLFILHDEFWIYLKNILTEDGTVIFNSWGLPQQLSPLKGNTVQKSIAKFMGDHFSYLSALPNRRNITFIAHLQQVPVIRQIVNTEDFNAIDRLIVEFFPQRIKYAKKIKSENFKTLENDVILTMDEFNDEMYKRWPHLVEKCNEALVDLGYTQIRDIMELLDDPIKAKKMTKLLLERNAIESATIPVLVGAYSFHKPEGLDWYLYWMLEEAEELMDTHKEWVINTALWQLLEVAANPYANYDYWASDIELLFNKLGLR
nr:hypothetical protein [Halobacillus sp. A1]